MSTYVIHAPDGTSASVTTAQAACFIALLTISHEKFAELILLELEAFGTVKIAGYTVRWERDS